MARLLISIVVIFVLSMVLGYVVHGVLLGDDYTRLQNLFRAPEDAHNYFAYMLLAHVVFAIAFVWIYLQGKAHKPFLMQGLRYGVAVAALVTVPMYLIYYAVQPMPGMTVLKQIAFDGISMIILGVVVAWLNRQPVSIPD
ncbi:MAG: hypothetical protein H7X91_08205 [Burkholderiales bacterium]|nr:hypothetical protein [Burkholderiales bacterium]